jgi:hypothetical protein
VPEDASAPARICIHRFLRTGRVPEGGLSCRTPCRRTHHRRTPDRRRARRTPSARMRDTAERLLVDVAGLCVAARGTDYVAAVALRRRGRGRGSLHSLRALRAASPPPMPPS